MNGFERNQEREALITGDRAALDPDEAADVALLATLLTDQSVWAEPDADVEDGVARAVDDAVMLAGDASAPSGRRAARRAALSRGRRITTSAAVAAAAIATVLGTVMLRGPGAGPDFTARLSATAAAPNAHASAEFTRQRAGFRVVLDARGLPKLPSGKYYEAWLKNSAGTLVPIGTFSSSAGRVTLWSGVSPKGFRTISVTIEATDGDEGSSGRRVLVGEVRGRN